MAFQRSKPTLSALEKATALLARQEQSSKRLRDKLRLRGYEQEEIDAAIARLQEKRYLNDEEACQRQFEFLYEESRQSVRQICAKLMQRGFESSLVHSCIPKDGNAVYERESKAADKCLYLSFKPGADEQRMLRYLYSRGFENSICRSAVERFQESWESEEN